MPGDPAIPWSPTGAELRELAEATAALGSELPGTWAGGDRLPDGSIAGAWFAYDEQVTAFFRMAWDRDWMVAFDWGAWLRTLEDPLDTVIDQGDTDTLRRVLTSLVRRDRFVEGSFGRAVADGLLARIGHRALTLAEAAAPDV